VHRCKVLKDGDLVPDDTVDDGEQGQVKEVLDGRGLDLSYLWLLDSRYLGRRSLKPASPMMDSSIAAAKQQGTSRNTQGRKQDDIQDEDKSGENDDDGAETPRDGSGDEARTRGSSKSMDGRESADEGDAEVNNDGRGKSQVGSLAVDLDRKIAPAAEPLSHEKTKKRSEGKGGKGGRGDVGEDEPQAEKPQQATKKRGRLVPGSLVLTCVSATGMPNTEKGAFSKQDPYLVVKWGEQEVRTSAKRDSGKDCSWPKEELALIVRTKKHLQEPIQVEVWNDNAGDKKPSPDVLIGKGDIPVKHLALKAPAAPSSTIGVGGKSGKSSGAERADMKNSGRVNRRGGDFTDDEGGSEGLVVTVGLIPGEKRRPKKTNVTAGTVTLTLEYTPPRRKPRKVTKEDAAAAAAEGKAREGGDDRTATDTDDD
ncbi:unnamed protein product, partial [Hapterophycus canaliculatus]